MTNQSLRAGRISVYINGNQQDAAGHFTYNIGESENETLSGADGVHGFKVKPLTPFVEGEIRDSKNLNYKELQGASELQITLKLETGKTIALYDAWHVGSSDVKTEDGVVSVRFEGAKGEQV